MINLELIKILRSDIIHRFIINDPDDNTRDLSIIITKEGLKNNELQKFSSDKYIIVEDGEYILIKSKNTTFENMLELSKQGKFTNSKIKNLDINESIFTDMSYAGAVAEVFNNSPLSGNEIKDKFRNKKKSFYGGKIKNKKYVKNKNISFSYPDANNSIEIIINFACETNLPIKLIIELKDGSIINYKN